MEPTPTPPAPAAAGPETDVEEYGLGAGIDFADPNSPLAPLYLRTSHVVATALLCVLFVLLSHLKVWHTDVWGHLRFGEYMVQTGRLPEREMFSGDYADQNAPYINYQWIAQGGAYLVFDLGRRLAGGGADSQLGGGALLLVATHATIVTLRFVVLLLVFRRLTGTLPAALLGVGLVVTESLFCHLGILRPQILGELGFALLLLALSRPVLSNRALVLIPLVFLVWVNTHGSFLMGLVLLGLFLAGRSADVFLQSGRSLSVVWHDSQIRRLAFVLGVSVVATFCNPHGPALLWRAWKLTAHPNIHTFEEWKRIPFTQAPGIVFAISLVVLVVALISSKQRPTATQILLLLAFGSQTVLHARVFVWWVMIVVWVALPHLVALIRRLRLASFEEWGQPNLRRTVQAVLAGAVVLLWSAPAQWAVWGDRPSGIKKVHDSTPVVISNYLRQQYTSSPGLSRVVFPSETQGEFLLWDLRLDPPVRIFCYTHVHLLTPDHWADCVKVKNGDDGWQDILDRNGVAFLIVEEELHPRLAGRVRARPDRWEIVPTNGPQLLARRKYQE